jgi:hypothetical protein
MHPTSHIEQLLYTVEEYLVLDVAAKDAANSSTWATCPRRASSSSPSSVRHS